MARGCWPATWNPGTSEILAERVPPADRPRFRSQPGKLPDVDFPAGSFGAILCARTLHFLLARDIELTVRKMFDWLLPGGRVFLITDSPYVGPWWKSAPEYERRKREGCPWPGFVNNYARPAAAGHRYDEAPEPSSIRSTPTSSGGSPGRPASRCSKPGFLRGGGQRATGREHAGVIARKPGA